MTKARDLSNLISGGTISNDYISLDAAEIPNLDTSKITTGTFADARISQSSVSQHATSFDDNKIVNDISTLALRQASDANRSAYNTNSQFVDVFQDSTGIGATSNAVRSVDEYVFAGSQSSVAYSSLTSTTYSNFGAWSMTSTAHAGLTNGSGLGVGASPTATNGGGFIADLGSIYTFNSGEMFGGCYRGNGDQIQYKVEYSTDGSTYTPIDFSGSSYTNGIVVSGSSSNVSSLTSGGIVVLSGHSANGHSSIHKITSVPTFDARYIRWTNVQSIYHDANTQWGELDFTSVQTDLLVASGNFTGTTITAPSTVSSMGGIITYQDQSGTNALNTDIVLQLSADGGSNWSTATLTALPNFATGIKMAKVNDLAVTAGTNLKYKISIANQSSGSKEARIRGVALQY